MMSVIIVFKGYYALQDSYTKNLRISWQDSAVSCGSP